MDQEDLGMIDILIFAVIYALLAAGNLIRLVKGPTGMVAADSMDILVACAMVLFSIYSGRGIYLDIAIITAMLGILNTMLVGRYLDTGRWHKK